MKKLLLILVAVVVIAVLVLLGIGFGFGKGSGNGDGDGNTKFSQEESSTAENDITEEQTTAHNDGATNADKESVIKVSVIGNAYFYENERISLDDFIAKVENRMLSAYAPLTVEVKDDNASLKAYSSLIERLEELKVPFTEK